MGRLDEMTDGEAERAVLAEAMRNARSLLNVLRVGLLFLVGYVGYLYWLQPGDPEPVERQLEDLSSRLRVCQREAAGGERDR